MNMGCQVFPWTLVPLLSKDKASHEAGCAQLGAGGLQGNASLSQSCPRREQQEPLAIWAVWGMESIAPAQECITSIQELPLPVQCCSWRHLSTRGKVEMLWRSDCEREVGYFSSE